MEFNCLQEHQDEILEFMRSHDYAETYVQRYRTTIKQITENAGKNNWQSYEDVYRWYWEKPYRPSYLREIKAILGKLELFHLHDLLPDGKKSLSSLRKVKPAYTKLNEEYTLLYDSFESRISQGLKESTVASYRTKITSFLLDLQNLGCDRLSAVTETAVLSCILKGEERKRNANVCSRLAYFFRFLSESGNSEASRILHYIPPMRFARKNIDYLTDEEIHSIREALVDTNNGLHLKDRAIGRLLLHTGMRGIDIARLQLSSIDWEMDQISIIQSKTGQPLQLPLLPIVGNAIYDYCLNERPVSELPYIFLGNNAPHPALTTDGIAHSVKKIMAAAGIRQEKGRRRGTHIFRHHLAVTMLANGIPQPVITETMGHTAPESLSSYLYADIKHLRECALSVEIFPMSKEVFLLG